MTEAKTLGKKAQQLGKYLSPTSQQQEQQQKIADERIKYKKDIRLLMNKLKAGYHDFD
jgi:hypothetical protein